MHLEDASIETLYALHYGNKYELYECIIPKGALYYAGLSSSGISSYGSTYIKFIKKVDVWLYNLYRWILQII